MPKFPDLPESFQVKGGNSNLPDRNHLRWGIWKVGRLFQGVNVPDSFQTGDLSRQAPTAGPGLPGKGLLGSGNAAL